MDQTIIDKVQFIELWKLVLVFIYDDNHISAMLIGALRAFPLVVDPPSRVEGALLWRKSTLRVGRITNWIPFGAERMLRRSESGDVYK